MLRAARRSVGTAESGRRTGSRAADEQVLAANVDVALVVTSLDGDFNLASSGTSPSRGPAGPPVIVLSKADVADGPPGCSRRRGRRARCRGPAIAALTGDGVAALADDRLPPGRTAVVLGSGVGKSASTRCSATSACRRCRARTTRAAATPPIARRPAAGRRALIDTPGIARSASPARPGGLEAAFADIADLARAASSRLSP